MTNLIHNALTAAFNNFTRRAVINRTAFRQLVAKYRTYTYLLQISDMSYVASCVYYNYNNWMTDTLHFSYTVVVKNIDVCLLVCTYECINYSLTKKTNQKQT